VTALLRPDEIVATRAAITGRNLDPRLLPRLVA
jgi:hypothetical protein